MVLGQKKKKQSDYEVDLDWCRDSTRRILDILYGNDKITIHEWRLVFGRIQAEYLAAEASLAINRVISTIKMIPVPVPIPIGPDGQPHQHEQNIISDTKPNPLSG
jgi:hypothetical protein